LNRSGDAALHAVSGTGDAAIAEAVVEAGADVSTRAAGERVCILLVSMVIVANRNVCGLGGMMST